MEKNKNGENFEDLNDFNSKYNHYYESDSMEDISSYGAASESQEVTEFEDISSNSGEPEDLYSNSTDDYDENTDEVDDNESDNKSNKSKKEGNFFSKNKYRNTKIIALCLVIVIILSAGGVLVYLYTLTNKMKSNDDGIDYNSQLNTDDYLDDEDVNFNAMGDVNANSLNDFLYKWANNGGEHMYDNNVINVLLCGVDSTSGTAASGRSDSMILVSLNKKTEKITMVSLLRDSWTYINAPRQDGTTYDYYFKMNSAYSLGGPATLLKTIENNFKVRIDQYIAVDFSSFPKLIDAVGGVKVNVQEYEAAYIRRTSSQKNFPSGNATLNGKQALIFSRIRHSDGDSDVSRTRRQRTVIKALIASAKTATNGQLVNAFKQVSPYLRTGYSQTEVISLLAQAYSHGWMSFEMNELMLPNEDYKDRLSTYVGDQSAWVVDYALCAQKLQNALYGKTNIVLSADRTSALDLVTNRKPTTGGSSSGSGSSSSGSSSNSDSNYDYDTTTSKRYTTSQTEKTTETTSEKTVATEESKTSESNTTEDNGGDNE